MKQNEKTTWFSRLTALLLPLASLGGVLLLTLMLAAVLARAFTQYVLVDAIGMSEEHPLIELFLEERKTNAAKEEKTIDSERTAVQRIADGIQSVRAAESDLERLIGDYTLGRNFFTRLVNRTEHAIGYDLNAFGDEAILLLDDYCYTLEQAKTEAEINEEAKNMRTFADALEERGIPFLYAAVPNKVCIETDWMSGTLDFSEQNRVQTVAKLRELGIDVLDLTDLLHAEGRTHRELFFPTDHHWTPATALWAADRIAEYAEKQYGLQLDRTVLHADQYEVELYEDVFLGSAGQKVTESKIAPDDFPLYVPKYETDMHLYLQRSNGETPRVDERGDFLLQYDMYYLEIFAPILESDIYSTYLYANPCKVRIKNYRKPDGLKVLLIGDSYDNVLIPFIAQAAGETIALDRRFASNADLHEKILTEEIDLVVSTVTELDRLLP